MSETQFLNSATETDSNFKSPHLSTSCSHLPVKFTIYEPDPEDSDDSHRLAQVSISNNMVDTKAIGDPFDDNEGKRSVMSSVLGPYVLKNTLSNSFASIPNHIRSGEYKNKQYNTSKQSCQNNAINSLLTSKTSLSSSSIIGSHKLHQSSQNIPLIGLRSNSNLTISSLSTVQSRHIVESSSTSALSNQNVSKPSRSRPRRFANLYSTMPVNHSSLRSTSSKGSSPFKRRHPRSLMHVPLNGDLNWTEDMFWTLNNCSNNNNSTITTKPTPIPTTPNKSVYSPSSPHKINSSFRRRHPYYQSLTPSYRTKLEQFRRIFRDTPVDTERLLVDYSCALSKNNNGLLLQGRMYITETWVCFYSKILYEQKIFLAVNEIVAITKEKTARVIPNAIQILYSKNHERFFFTSFASRERSYAILRKVWENCRNHQTMSIDEILQQIRDMYGDYSLAMVEDEEDTDGDAELVPTTFPHMPRTLSDSSLSSQLTGRSKSASLEDVCHSDQPVNLDRSSKCSVLGTTDDELKVKLGPRTCTAVEQQTLLSSESISGKRYIIDAKVTNHAVPLSNCFYVVSRYCLLYVNRTTSRLHVSSQVIYEKPVFFGAKSIIENTCHSGLSDFFDTITIKLKEFSTNLSLEERLTGGWLAQQRGCLNNITPSLNPSNIQNNPLLIQSVNGNQNNRKLNKVDTLFTGNVNSSKVPASRYSDLAKSSIFNNCINDNTNVKKQNKTTLFGSGDMTYLFMRPDRAWLLLVVIGLLLCLFLSMVYNRLVVLEKLAEQFPPLSAHDRNHFHDLFGTSPQEDRGSIPIYKDHLASKSPEWARTRLKVMKDLIHLLSKTLIQMQQTLTQVQQGIELLEFPPSNLEDNIKTSMNVKTPTNTDTNCPDTQTKHVP
ncbi:unnamed protein product [Schistosoma haematobium]|nr:unnamed protein product [Schistosoma haematobium]